jgi:uncharacterized protein YqjF (DUF2071 family)
VNRPASDRPVPDRLAPANRPEGRNAGTQTWKDLLFLHWEVPVAAMRAVVPESLDLDLFEGRAYVGIVPFAMRSIRPAFLPPPFALDFLETNVRTYVLHRGDEPGVYFFSLDASSWLAVRAARLGWSLPYYDADMSMAQSDGRIDYSTHRRDGRASLETAWSPGETLGASAPGTVEHFLLERYILYAERRGRLYSGRVHHPPYPARRATLHSVQESLVAAAGLPASSGPPAFVHASDGVDVEVFALRPVGV